MLYEENSGGIDCLRGVPDGNDFALLREETARRRRFEVLVLSNFYDWIFSKT